MIHEDVFTSTWPLELSLVQLKPIPHIILMDEQLIIWSMKVGNLYVVWCPISERITQSKSPIDTQTIP